MSQVNQVCCGCGFGPAGDPVLSSVWGGSGETRMWIMRGAGGIGKSILQSLRRGGGHSGGGYPCFPANSAYGLGFSAPAIHARVDAYDGRCSHTDRCGARCFCGWCIAADPGHGTCAGNRLSDVMAAIGSFGTGSSENDSRIGVIALLAMAIFLVVLVCIIGRRSGWKWAFATTDQSVVVSKAEDDGGVRSQTGAAPGWRSGTVGRNEGTW